MRRILWIVIVATTLSCQNSWAAACLEDKESDVCCGVDDRQVSCKQLEPLPGEKCEKPQTNCDDPRVRCAENALVEWEKWKECLSNRSETVVREGGIFAAIERQNKCEKLIANSQH